MADLEERTIESLSERCANCGAVLTQREKELALELETTPVLCSTCAAEQQPADAEDAGLEL
jgi:hypothetical protein